MKNIFFIVMCLLGSFFIKAQNVGIGTNTPGAKLEVVGQVKITGGVPGEGKVLTSDATGLASWQNNNATGGGGSVGYGSWGDCSVNNISEYNPVGIVGTSLGMSVSIDGNYAVVGSPNDSVGPNAGQGSASVFEFNGTNWVFMQKIVDVSGAAGDAFGSSVSMSGTNIIVGSPSDDVGANVNQGSISIFKLIGGNWVLQNKIVDALGGANDNLGNAVSISGSYAVAGASGDDVGANVNQGAILIFQSNAGNWSLLNKVTELGGQANDLFGYSVAITSAYLIVGIVSDDVGANLSQGSANLYKLAGNSWFFTQKITDPSGLSGDQFGWAVAIAGTSAIVGSDSDDVGANVNQGSASIFNLNGVGTWVQSQKITEPTGVGVASGFFGSSVAISGNYAIIGASGGGIADHGAVTIYISIGGGWQKVQYFKDPGATSYDTFGFAVGVDVNTKRFVVGSPTFANVGKVAFGKIN